MTKQTKTKIGVGSVVKAKVGELEKIPIFVLVLNARDDFSLFCVFLLE